MRDVNKYFWKAAAAATLGVLSGVITYLTLTSPMWPMWAPFTGIVFALFHSLYSSLWEGARSLQKIIGFILVTTSAFWIAVLAGLVANMGSGGVESPDFGKNVLFVGGIVGTALVALARYHFLAFAQSRNAVIWRVLLISLVGGALGQAVGWPSFSSHGSQMTFLFPVFIVWQGCISPMLVVLFPSFAMSGETHPQPASSVPAETFSPLPAWKKIVMLVAFVFLAYWLVREIRLERQATIPQSQPRSLTPAT